VRPQEQHITQHCVKPTSTSQAARAGTAGEERALRRSTPRAGSEFSPTWATPPAKPQSCRGSGVFCTSSFHQSWPVGRGTHEKPRSLHLRNCAPPARRHPPLPTRQPTRHPSPGIAPTWLPRPSALLVVRQPLPSSLRAPPQSGTPLPVAPEGVLQQAGELGVAVGHMHDFLALVPEGTDDVSQGQLPTQRKGSPQIQFPLRTQPPCRQLTRPGVCTAA